ncbi:ribonuclease P protein component [Candidatus Saccharibacteria bacterium]|nr:ribonuclease P protein component [Candidatus Saccharibacteria bacterium]
MLSKKYRFHSRGGVRYTYKDGKTLRTKNLSLVFAPNTRHHQRFAVVVSKKVTKSAVARNRIRRRIYEAIRHELNNYTIKNDCIFIVYSKDFATAPFPEITAAVHGLLQQTMI